MITFPEDLDAGWLCPDKDRDSPSDPTWDDCSAAVVPDLVNVLFPTGDAFRWFVVQLDGDVLYVEDVWDTAVEFDTVGLEDEVGEASPALQQERENCGWIDMMDLPWDANGKLLWCLENGIAPGQPFLFRFGKPTYVKCGSYYEPEVDVEYEAELVRVIPWTLERSLAAWETYQRERQAYLDYKAECDERLRVGRLSRTDCLYLESRVCFAPGQSSYDDMEMPRGIRYRLYSNYKLESTLYDVLRGLQPIPNGIECLASAESHEGSHEEALNKLIERAVGLMPHLTPDVIRKLPKW